MQKTLKNIVSEKDKGLEQRIETKIGKQLQGKANLSGAFFIGKIYVSRNSITVSNKGDGKGYLMLRNLAGPAHKRDYVLVSRNDGTLDLESWEDSEKLVNRWTFDHTDGTLDCPGKIFQEGKRVLTENDVINERPHYIYSSSFPSLTRVVTAKWFNEGAEVTFVDVGSGVISLPEIVGSDPSEMQILAGKSIVMTNYNRSHNITLSRFHGQKFMSGNAGSITTSSVLGFYSNSAIRIQALDLNAHPGISAWCWGIRTI